MLVMDPAIPARRQSSADSRMLRQSHHCSLFSPQHRLDLLCKSTPHCRRRRSRLGRHPGNGSPEIPE